MDRDRDRDRDRDTKQNVPRVSASNEHNMAAQDSLALAGHVDTKAGKGVPRDHVQHQKVHELIVRM